MKIFGRAPRVRMDTVNSMNKLLPPATRPWPAGFSAHFVTNVTKSEAEADGPWGEHAVKGELFFEAGRRQRVFHAAGARECERFYNTEGSCSLVFAEGAGMFALTDGDKNCCLDMPDLHTPSSNWTVETKHHFVETRRFKGRMCHGFQYRMGINLISGKAGAGGHIYWQDLSGLPCAFEFVGDDRLAWFFDVGSVKEGPQVNTLFHVPASCGSNRCPPPSLGGDNVGDSKREGMRESNALSLSAVVDASVAQRGDRTKAPAGDENVQKEQGRTVGGSSNFEGLVQEVVGLVEAQSSMAVH